MSLNAKQLSNLRDSMLKKLFCLVLVGAAFLPLSASQLSASEKNDSLARIHWNININTGFYPCYCGPYGGPYGGPYWGYPYPPCGCGYPPPPYWAW